MNIAVAQTHSSSDVDANKVVVEGLVADAASQKADLIVCPEMTLFEFFPRKPHCYEYFDIAEPIPGPATAWFQELARQNNIHIVFNHYERSREHVYFDTSVVIDRTGRYIGRQRMMHIAEEPGYNEKFYYAPGWDDYHVFELGGWRFGVATCYDRHYPEVFRSFCMKGAELVLIPTAVAKSEPFADVFELEARAAAVTHGVYIAMANRSGTEDPLTFLGNSMIVDPVGTVQTRLGEEANVVCVGRIDKQALIEARRLFPFLRDRRPETYGMLTAVPGANGGGPTEPRP